MLVVKYFYHDTGVDKKCNGFVQSAWAFTVVCFEMISIGLKSQAVYEGA